MGKSERWRWKLAVGTCWRARSGVGVVIKRYDHGRVWFSRLDSDEARSQMLTRGQFVATFPREIA